MGAKRPDEQGEIVKGASVVINGRRVTGWRAAVVVAVVWCFAAGVLATCAVVLTAPIWGAAAVGYAVGKNGGR